MKTKLYFTSLFLVAVCAAWWYPFYCILVYGTHTVTEPSLPILLAEIGLFVGLIGFGIWNIIKMVKGG